MTGDRLFAEDVAALAPAAMGPPAPQVDLRLTVGPAGNTFLSRQRAAYPFHLGRSLSVPGDPPGMATLYVQSCSGGIFEHDRLGWRVVAETGSRTHLTSSAATIVHAMADGAAAQDVAIEAHAGALVEYLPDPLILFSDARLSSRVCIAAHPEATVFAADAFVPHDPGGGERPFGWIDAETRMTDLHGTLLARDRYRLNGAHFADRIPGISGTFRCQGSFVALTRQMSAARLAAALRERVQASSDAYASASTLPRDCGAWVRVLAADAAALREALRLAWYAARSSIFGAEPAPRRK